MSRSRNNAPQDPTNFFAKTYMVIACLFIFPPAGIYLLWKNHKFDPAVRVILSALFGIVFIYNSIGWFSPDIQPKPPKVPQSQVGDIPNQNSNQSSIPPEQNPSIQQEYQPPELPTPNFSDQRLLKVHFLDVGQADSIVVETPEKKIILVDGGNNEDAPFIINYLKSLHVQELAAVIATHPHEDHIGGLDQVLEAYPVKEVYMPEVSHTTNTYQDFISAVDQSGAKKIRAKVGRTISTDDPFLSTTFLAPNSNQYESLNNYSAVLKVSFKDVSFLLAGDAESISESEMLKNNRNVSAAVLKVGHHGSKTSSTKAFLEAVKPAYAVISLGKDNDYGFPHTESMQRLMEAGIKILRTDVSGTIIIETDGEKLGVRTSQ